MAEVNYEIVKEIGVLSSKNNGWRKEINLVSWNSREPVYDLRSWSEDHEKASKGITLTADEFKELLALMSKMEI